MSVIDLHPDDLLDLEARGGLTPADRERLDAHLARCAACRIERTLRRDFAVELAATASATNVAGLVSHALSAVRVEPALPAAPRAASALPRRRLAVALAFAAVMVTGVAVAGWTGALRAVFPSLAAPAAAPAQPVAQVAPARSQRPMQPTEPAARAVDIAPALDEPSEPVAAAPVVAPSEAVVARANPPPAAPAPFAPAPRATARAPEAAVSESEPAPLPSAPALAASAPTAAPQALVAGPAQLFADANAARRARDDVRAALLYRELTRAHPASAEARVARASLAQLLLEHRDAPGALAGFDEALSSGPQALAEEMLVGRAVALERMGDAAGERAAWSRLLGSFPSSVHAARARARLDALRAP